MASGEEAEGGGAFEDLDGWREGAGDALPRAQREKRLKIRCWRRGTKEMDLLLGPFVDARAARLSDEALAELEALVREDDGALYGWIAGGAWAPARHARMVAEIRAFHGAAGEAG